MIAEARSAIRWIRPQLTVRVILVFVYLLTSCLDLPRTISDLIVNVLQELVLIRSLSDNNVIKWTKYSPTDTSDPEKVQVKLYRLAWGISYVTLGDKQKIALPKQLSRVTKIPVEYRAWDLYKLLTLPITSTFLDSEDCISTRET